MSVKSDIARLEKELGDPGVCPHGWRVVWPEGEGPDPGPEICEQCGRPRMTFRVVYDDDWRDEA